MVLEYTTPPEYVFGYLYSGPILMANSRLGRSATLKITLTAAALTLLNLVLPTVESFNPSTLANRLIVVMALLVTGWLSDRNRRYEEALAQQRSQLLSQQQLAGIREDFVSTLTHDLKTPLLGAIETIKSFQSGQFGVVSSPQQKVLEMMARSHRSTLELVQTLLDVYRNDAEGLQLQLAPINLVSLAEEVTATLIDLAATRRVYVSLNYDSSDFRSFLWVKGDALQLRRVFTNLLINGINHSPRGGKVEIVLEFDSGCGVVKILDRGQGITSDELPHLFDRFYQGHSNRQATGSGLGLYLSRQIIEAHGGTIWAENRSPLGALFGFRLPINFIA
ncbi:HAMP domain-containing histidine kinase [Argonema galeatum A003/A1]|nr:HAMP domain-containing sensor histidine kinase [Argonema galeatum]MCL1464140.1 HAMP domain-containing histidine kinase [Argonema galeatum A003/A1]